MSAWVTRESVDDRGKLRRQKCQPGMKGRRPRQVPSSSGSPLTQTTPREKSTALVESRNESRTRSAIKSRRA